MKASNRVRCLLCGAATAAATACSIGPGPAATAQPPTTAPAPGGPPCPIVPRPKVYAPTGRTVALADGAAIILSAEATEPERYAAERLQSLVRRRFERKLPVRAEDWAARSDQPILLGRPATHGRLADLCRGRKIELSEDSPGHDGFVIHASAEGVVIGGSNARGVIYGTDAFFDLLRVEGGKVVFPAASVRDAPDIPWRGRPYSRPERHLAAGVFDAYVRARLNWIDLRDGPPPRRGQFGYPPGFKINVPQARKILAEAHRRGFFVYATVQCSVPEGRFEAVTETCGKLLDLGADGVWISYDDPGEGAAAPELIGRLLKFAAGRGITGRKVVVVPPTGSYQRIETDWNRAAAAVKGFEQATWLFTRSPCAADAAAAGRIGLKRPPGWWHNWPRTSAGFTHRSYGGGSLRAGGKPAYLDLPPLRVGWHRPTYDALRGAGRHTDTVMMWGGWPEEYTAAVLGLWAWDPDGHDWSRTRRAIYGYVFGPAQAGAARTFDDALARLKRLFRGGRSGGRRAAPLLVLNRSQDRPAAEKLLRTMGEALETLRRGAPKATAIDPERLERTFLEPMQATVDIAGKVLELDLPQEAPDRFEQRMLRLLAAEKGAEAGELLTQTKARLGPRIKAAEKALAGLKGVEGYAKTWKAFLSGLDYWRDRLARERRREAERKAREARFHAENVEKIPQRFKRLVTGDYGKLLERRGSPPPGKPLAEIAPSAWTWKPDPPPVRGVWGIGLYESPRGDCVAIAYPGKTSSRPGYFAEVRAEIDRPRFEGRLILDAFVADTHVTDRWTGYRFMQLRVNDKVVWEADIATDRAGKEWVSVDVTEAAGKADTLRLRFRVEDRRGVGNYSDVTFLGPVRLREGPSP